MSRHELRPHVHSACAHFKCCLETQKALGPSLEDARTTIRVPAMEQRARFSMLACALAVTLPLIALSFTAPVRADVLLRPPASMSTTQSTADASEPPATASVAVGTVSAPAETNSTPAEANTTPSKTISGSAAPSTPETAPAPAAPAPAYTGLPLDAALAAAPTPVAEVKPPMELSAALPDAAWLGPSALLKQGLSALQWSQVSAQAQAELKRNHLDGFVYSPRIASIFARYGIDGSFIAQRLGTNYLFGYNFLLAQHKFAPDATFNFVSAYLSLALQAVPDIDVKFLNYRDVAAAPSATGLRTHVPELKPQDPAVPQRTNPPQEAQQERSFGHMGFTMGKAWPHPVMALAPATSESQLPPEGALVPDEKLTHNKGEAQEPKAKRNRSADEMRRMDAAFHSLYPVYPYDSDTSMRVAFTTGNAKVNSYWAELVEPSRIQQALELLGLSTSGLVITDANKRTFWQDRSLQYSLITEVAFLNRLAQCSLTGSSLQHDSADPNVDSDEQVAQMMTWAKTGTLVDHALIAAQKQHQNEEPTVKPQAKSAAGIKERGLISAANAQSESVHPAIKSTLSSVQQRHQDICNQVLDVAVVAVFDQQGNVVRLSNGRGDNDLNRYNKYYVLYGKSNVIDGGSALFQQQIYRYAGLISDEQGHVVSFALAVPMGPKFSAHDGAHLLNQILQETLLLPKSHDLSMGLALQEHKDEIPPELYGSNFGANNIFNAAGETNVSLLKMPLSNFGASSDQISALQGAYLRNHNLTKLYVAQTAMLDAMGPDLQQLALQGSNVTGHVLTGLNPYESAQNQDGAHHRSEEPGTMMPRRPALDGRTGAASKNLEAEIDLSQVEIQTNNNAYASYRQGVINDINSPRYPHTQDTDDMMAMLEDDYHGLDGKEVLHDYEGNTAGSVRRSVFANSVLDKAQERVEQAQAGVSAECIEQQASDKRQAFFDVIDEISHQETPVSALERQRMVRASTEAAQSASIMNDIAEQRQAQRELAQASGARESDPNKMVEAEVPVMVDDRYHKCPPEDELLQLQESELKARGLEDCLKIRRNASTSNYPAVSYNEAESGKARSGREPG